MEHISEADERSLHEWFKFFNRVCLALKCQHSEVDVLAAIKVLQHTIPVPISVQTALPSHDQEVLAFWPKVLGGDQRWVKARFSHADRRKKGAFDTAEFVLLPVHQITHWLPMPQPPTEV
jgi:hypothetical protein